MHFCDENICKMRLIFKKKCLKVTQINPHKHLLNKLHIIRMAKAWRSNRLTIITFRKCETESTLKPELSKQKRKFYFLQRGKKRIRHSEQEK